MDFQLNEEFSRIQRLPPYVFNIVNDLKMEAHHRGEDIIDFGMGNPDQPTPPHIVGKMIDALKHDEMHRYSLSRGITPLREAICNWYKRRYDIELDPETEVKTGDLIKSVISEVGRTKAKEVSNYILKMVGERSKLPKDLVAKRQSLGRLDELEVLRDASSFYASEFQAAVEVLSEDDNTAYDPKEKSKSSKPYRPGIFLE